ncbi:hypothetical protein [Streptomyces flavotricini]|uniref:hypothetical protein n=1 Tax=Streptomyces flavotricini TaxID=66888 RepID=UPI001E2DE808|nr:hypothetical protein [Streptomyces flavotricini]
MTPPPSRYERYSTPVARPVPSTSTRLTTARSTSVTVGLQRAWVFSGVYVA